MSAQPVDVLAWLDSLHETMPDGSVTNRKWSEAQEARASLEELIACAKRCRHELSLAKPHGGTRQDAADIAGAVEILDAALARCGAGV